MVHSLFLGFSERCGFLEYFYLSQKLHRQCTLPTVQIFNKYPVPAMARYGDSIIKDYKEQEGFFKGIIPAVRKAYFPWSSIFCLLRKPFTFCHANHYVPFPL